MRKDIGRRLVCKKFCKFYKPGKKEEMKCGTYDFLSRNLTRGELLLACRYTGPSDRAMDREISSMICSRCDFREDGCDYRDGLAFPPCGGYMVVESLLKRYGVTGKRKRSH